MEKVYISLILIFAFHTFFEQVRDTMLRRKEFLIPVGFIENKGQIKNQNGQSYPEILYVFSGKNFKLSLKNDGFILNVINICGL